MLPLGRAIWLFDFDHRGAVCFARLILIYLPLCSPPGFDLLTVCYLFPRLQFSVALRLPVDKRR